MEKNEIKAYMIMESTSEGIDMNAVEECKTDSGLFYLRFPTVLQRFNADNRNGRNYGDKAMTEGLMAENVQELYRDGNWMGEAGHPIGGDMERILTIDPANTSHRIVNFDVRGDYLHGTVETLDDGAQGTRMTKNILQGITPTFSLRALAKLMKRPGRSTLIRTRPRIVTYDWVYLPSHKEARIEGRDKIQQVRRPLSATSGQIVTESLIPVLESQILDFIKEESVNVKLTSDLCEVALEGMSLSPDGKLVYVKEGHNTYAMAVEDHLHHEIRSYMSNI